MLAEDQEPDRRRAILGAASEALREALNEPVPRIAANSRYAPCESQALPAKVYQPQSKHEAAPMTPEWTTVALTFVLVVVTSIYAYLTKRIVDANENVVRTMQEQARQALRPYVNVKTILDPVSLLMSLKIENIGKSPAKRLRLQVDRSFFQYAQKKEERDLSKLHAFSHEIGTFPPGAELVFNLAQGFNVFGPESDPAITPTTFAVTAVYHGDEEYRETTVVDLRPHLMTAGPTIPLKDELKQVQRELQRIANSIGTYVTMQQRPAAPQTGDEGNPR